MIDPDLQVVRDRLRWWRLPNLCDRVGHFWREVEPDVDRCRLCKTLVFRNATFEQLERQLLDASVTAVLLDIKGKE